MEGPASPRSGDAVQQLPSTESTPSMESTPSPLLDGHDQDAVQQATGAVGGPAQTVDAVDSAASKPSQGWKDAVSAAQRGDVQRLRELSDRGVNLSDSDSHGYTLALYAAFGGHVECLRALKNEFGVRLDAGDNNGLTPAHFAAARGHVECLRALSALEVSLDAGANDGRTPAFAAALGGHVECLRALKNELDVSLSAVDTDGQTLAHAAAGGGHVECLRALKNQDKVRKRKNDD